MEIQDAQTPIDNDDLRVRYSAGITSTLFVSFTGVGHGMGGLLPDEFVGTVRRHHALFVSDLKRTWYNGPDVADTIVRIVRETAAKLRTRRIVTIGNSMGGFGAILFARLLAADCAIAFSPQFSVHPDVVPAEDRWLEYVAGIREWPYPTPLPLRPETKYFIFSGRDVTESRHSLRFPRSSNVALFQLSGDHNIAARIKESGVLPKLVADCSLRPMGLAKIVTRVRLRAATLAPLLK